jgi:hypothetical protein
LIHFRHVIHLARNSIYKYYRHETKVSKDNNAGSVYPVELTTVKYGYDPRFYSISRPSLYTRREKRVESVDINNIKNRIICFAPLLASDEGSESRVGYLKHNICLKKQIYPTSEVGH